MHDAVAKSDKAETIQHCYYLRAPVSTVAHVDHTFECQLMGHALVQSSSWHGLYKAEGFIDKKISKQGVLRKSLDDVYAVQNSLVNLHLLDGGINESKAAVFHKAIKNMYEAKRAGGFDLGHELEVRCHLYFKDHHYDIPSDNLASRLLKAFEATQGPIVTELGKDTVRTSWSAADAIKQQHRMVELSESVVQLYDDLGC